MDVESKRSSVDLCGHKVTFSASAKKLEAQLCLEHSGAKDKVSILV